MPSSSLAARVTRAVAAGVCLALLAACSPDAPNAIAPPTSANLAAVGSQDDLGPARAAQARHTGRLLADADLVGTAVGRLDDGRPEITVFAKHGNAAARVPRELDGIPVVVEVTGEITALPAVADASPRAKPGGGGAGGAGIKPTDFARPAYIGMSTGNANECAAGTIGAKIVRGGVTYALSNNHVYARENEAAIGEKIYQPGRYDLGCATSATYEFATLDRYQDISFNGNNTADAALVRVNAGVQLNGSPPPGTYGALSSQTIAPALNMAVMKYGRTTALTTGIIIGIGATVRVQYTSGIATFVNQIQIRGDKGSFSRAGDSGSLIVTRTGIRPVGLLFAGGQTSTFANPIDAALAAVGGGPITP